MSQHEPRLHPKYARSEAVGTEIIHLCSLLYAAEYQLLMKIREFDAEGLWELAGICSCAHWLNWQCGIGLVAARFYKFRPFLDEPHAFRQAWTSYYTLEFFRVDLNILRPSIISMGDYRHVLVEFPVSEWLTALMYWVTGPTVALFAMVARGRKSTPLLKSPPSRNWIISSMNRPLTWRTTSYC